MSVLRGKCICKRHSTLIEKPALKSVAMAGADGDALASGGAAAAENGGTSIGLHARPEAVRFRAVSAVGLKCSFGHGYPLLFLKENLPFSSISEYIAGGILNPVVESSRGAHFTMWQGRRELQVMLKECRELEVKRHSVRAALQ
jgi:hypothetical protein